MTVYKKLAISLISLGILVLCIEGVRFLVPIEVFTGIFGALGGWQLGAWTYVLMNKIWPEL